jgi:hypothetical protein
MEPNDAPCRSAATVSTCPASAQHAAAHGPVLSKGRWAVVWGVGGTVLSTLGFVAWALFEQYNICLVELQRDLKHFHETSGDLVHKEAMKRCYEKLGECTKELQASGHAREQLQRELDASQKTRHELERELQQLRERLATVEGRQSATPIIVTLPADKSR